MITTGGCYIRGTEAKSCQVEVLAGPTFLRKAIEARLEIEDRVVGERGGVADVTAIVGAILEPERGVYAVDRARPIVTVFRIEAVIVVRVDAMLLADLVIDAGEPATVVRAA